MDIIESDFHDVALPGLPGILRLPKVFSHLAIDKDGVLRAYTECPMVMTAMGSWVIWRPAFAVVLCVVEDFGNWVDCCWEINLDGTCTEDSPY